MPVGISLEEHGLRVVFAHPAGYGAPALRLALAAEFELFEIEGTADSLLTGIIARSPDAAVLCLPCLDQDWIKCVNRVLLATRANVVLALGADSVKMPASPRVDTCVLNGQTGKGVEAAVMKVRRAGQARQSPGQGVPEKLDGPARAISYNVLKNYVVAIGASTGGVEATKAVLRALPGNMPGIVMVQHMPPGFTSMYAASLNQELSFTVTEAKDGGQIKPNTIHVGKAGRQLTVERSPGGYITRFGGSEKTSGHCPSVDVLFESVAKSVGGKAVGVILTGMGEDGAKGLLSMRRAGAYTVGQDRSSSVVYGMPAKAQEYGAVIKQAPLKDIPATLIAYLLRAR